LAIGVGFGAQNIIKNVISGIIILLERKVRVGDIIEQGGMTGHVTAIDLRATTVRGFDGIEALVPNSSLLETQVINWTYSNHQIRRELKIGVAYGSDTRAAELVLQNAAISHPKVLEVPAPEVFFEDFADSSLLMVLIFGLSLGRGSLGVSAATYVTIFISGWRRPVSTFHFRSTKYILSLTSPYRG
jgi:small-conductance mechanosensitive channel